MKITVLVDNNTLIDSYFIGEPAVSYLIECGNRKILFDVGYSDVFILNAQKLGIDLLDVDTIVLSHGHLDHTWGLGYLIRYFTEQRWLGKEVRTPKLIAHPDVFKGRSFESEPEIGSLLKEETLKKFFELKLTRKPHQLMKGLTFLGEIPRENDFEARHGIGEIRLDGGKTPDMVMDDSALVYQSAAGLLVITGCSHAGICNIIEYARKITGQNRVLDIIGGFHLLDPSRKQMEGTLTYFKSLQPAGVHACHCTDLGSKIKLSKVVKLHEVGAGLQLEF